SLAKQLRREDVVGVIGYDLFMRCVAEIDLKENTMDLRDSAGYQLKAGEWQKLRLHRNHPVVPCTFEGDHEELFLWDTGAGNNLAIFNAPASKRLGFLDRRSIGQAQAMGVGGATEMKVGFLDWFEVAGHRFEKPMVIFGLPQKGALNDPYIAGIIGNTAVSPF